MDPSEDACNSIEGGYTSPRDNVQDSDSSNNNNAIVVTQIGKTRRKHTSHVWTQLEILPQDYKRRAKCMEC
ncbi:zinc finger BED domain-containing RICESLEEPER, partial [Prunus dulcis]